MFLKADKNIKFHVEKNWRKWISRQPLESNFRFRILFIPFDISKKVADVKGGTTRIKIF